MAKTMKQAPVSAETIARVERIIAAYPAIETDDREFLLHWYRKQASAYDVGMLAANEAIHEGYKQFRADHIDRLPPADLLKALVWVALLGAVIYIIALAAN